MTAKDGVLELGLFSDPAPPDTVPEAIPPEAIPPKPKVWTVGEVNRAARLLLDQSLPQMWVSGEVANYSRHRSGHCYFTLKDSEAQLQCVIFRRDAARLPMDPDNGMTVRVFGGVTLYEARGNYQLVARKLEAESEGGMWKLAFDRLRQKLDAEGLTDPARRRPLPRFPQIVGVVTSPQSAAFRDIVAVISRRAPWVRLVVRGTSVQGEGASKEIARAVAFVASRGVDVVVVARGGGSVEDLWAFNEEPVARAVAGCRVPVISGVGHETDVTICDLVADLRAATPSAAAEAAVPERTAVSHRLDGLAARMGKALAGQARVRKDRLNRASEVLMRGVRRLVPARRSRLDRGREAIALAMKHQIRRESSRLAEASAAIETLSPLSTMARGYAVPLAMDGRLLRTADDFRPDARFRLRVVDGNVNCAVEGQPQREEAIHDH